METTATPAPARVDDETPVAPSWVVRGGFLAWALLVYVCYWLWLAQGTR